MTELLDLDPDALTGEERAIAWARRLEAQLDQRAPLLRQYRDYLDGNHPVKYATEAWRETFGDEFGPVVDNWCETVVDVPVERMTILGFRFIADDPRSDDDAWELWQRNRLDLYSDLAHSDAGATGYSYLLVWPDAKTSEPLITVEDPINTIVELDPSSPRRRLAGMKRWQGLDRTWRAQVWTPDATWLLELDSRDGWKVTTSSANTLAFVPIVPLTNNPDVYWNGRSDLKAIIPLQDAVNKLLSDMLIASEFAAFRQRVLLGAEIPTDEAGNPLFDLRGGINRWLAFEAADDAQPGRDPVPPQIQELEAADLSNYTGQIQELVSHIGALSKTPPQYLLAKLVQVSGDALRAAESGLVRRVRRKMRLFGEAWEEAMRLAFKIKGDEVRAGAVRAEIIWDDPEIVSEGSRIDGLVKLRQIGVPDEALWERLPDTSPEKIARWRRMRDEQAQREGFTLGLTPNGAGLEAPGAEAGAAIAA